MAFKGRSIAVFALSVAVFVLGSSAVSSQEKSTAAKSPEIIAPPVDRDKLQRLAPDADVWVDKQNKRLIIDGEVCLTRGFLEMFACPKDTKEHESVVSVNAKASVVHAALLAIGAKAGAPVQFDPKYVPASGTRIDVYVFWTDKDGKRRQAPAQKWVRNVKNKEPMEYHWVFAGSGFWKDEFTGKRHYLGDAGDFICVSNFPSATMDLPVKSSHDNENLLYEAFTENIPERGTKVTLVLVPRLEKGEAKEAKTEGNAGRE